MRIDCSITENYLKEKRKMTTNCTMVCSHCPFYLTNINKSISCKMFEFEYPAEAISAVQKWSDEHPTPTNKEKFIEVMKNVFGIELNITSDGVPLYLNYADKLRENLPFDECEKWWNEPYKEPKEKE